MPKNANQKLKLYHLFDILSKKTDAEHPMDAGALIAALAERGIEAERKSVYSDIEVLNEVGRTVRHTGGSNGGYYYDGAVFEGAELALLADAVQSSRFITKTKSSELIKKLQTLTNEYEARSISLGVHVSGRIKSMNESIYAEVDVLRQAIDTDMKVSFAYYDWNVNKEKVLRHGGARYTVSPMMLLWQDNYYYLVAQDAGDGVVKHFRLDKITSIKLTDKRRELPDELRRTEPGSYVNPMFGMFGGETEKIVLRCSERLAGVIIDRFGTEAPFMKRVKGTFDVPVTVVASNQFFSWVAGFAGEISILSPEKLKNEYEAFLENNLKRLKEERKG